MFLMCRLEECSHADIESLKNSIASLNFTNSTTERSTNEEKILAPQTTADFLYRENSSSTSSLSTRPSTCSSSPPLSPQLVQEAGAAKLPADMDETIEWRRLSSAESRDSTEQSNLTVPPVIPSLPVIFIEDYDENQPAATCQLGIQEVPSRDVEIPSEQDYPDDVFDNEYGGCDKIRDRPINMAEFSETTSNGSEGMLMVMIYARV